MLTVIQLNLQCTLLDIASQTYSVFVSTQLELAHHAPDYLEILNSVSNIINIYGELLKD